MYRAPVHNQSTSLEAMKGKVTGGGSVGDGASRWSTRQASLFYRRQNNRSFPCRRIPSLFSDVKVLTDADLIKESQGSSKNMVDCKSSSTAKRPSASCDQKTKQGQVNKAKETSGKKTCVSSQVAVKGSKCETRLKRKSSVKDICVRPSKRKPDMVRFVSKGVQKHADKKQTKRDCTSPKKTEVGNGGAHTIGSKDSTSKSVSPTHYKVLMTRPCSVPVVPVGTQRTGQQRSSTVLVLKKVLPSTQTDMNSLPIRKSLESVVSNLTDGGINKNVDNKVEDWEEQEDEKVLKMKLKPGAEETKDENSSEWDGAKIKHNVSNLLTENIASSLATDENGGSNTCYSTDPQCGIRNQSKEDSAEFYTVNENSLLCGNTDCAKTQESVTENVPIKRSARISERKANAISHSVATDKKTLGCENCPEKSHLVKGCEPDYDQSNTIPKVLSCDISNPSTTTTQRQHLKHKSNTKYTQRMTWQLQPQVAPINNVNPVSDGDIVWGKVHGHPWWPGKVLAISGIRNEDNKNPWDRDAHVSWFGSNTSSIMRLHSLQLFLPNFAKRHKRHKKGFYRVAVREAQEASQAMANEDCLVW